MTTRWSPPGLSRPRIRFLSGQAARWSGPGMWRRMQAKSYDRVVERVSGREIPGHSARSR